MHPYYTTSFVDREMFAHNANYQKQQAEMQRVLAQPENRIKYCFEFLTAYIQDGDDQMKGKCYNGIAKYSAQLDTSEAHF